MTTCTLTGRKLELMQALYAAVLDHLIQRFANKDVDTPLLRVAVAFLADQGIDAQSLSDARHGLARLQEIAAAFPETPDDELTPLNASPDNPDDF